MSSKESTPRGKIHTYVGPMCSGKTTALKRKIDIFNIAKKKCVIVSPKLDNRNGNDEKSTIVTHDKNYIKAIKCSHPFEILEIAEPYDVVGIDEAQFFANITKTCEILRLRGKIVIISMLNCDYQTKPFKAIDLVCVSDSVKHLKAICVSCFSPAIFSHRTSTSTELIDIGGIEKYKPLCYKCYHEENKDI